MTTPIYLDYNATTPIAKEVADTMSPYLYEVFGNPSSSHPYGVQAKLAIEKARKQVAEAIHAQVTEVLFTSGGTESNNYAIRGYALANQDRGRHIITSSIEHPAVLEVCRYLEKQGFRLTILPVDGYGLVNPEDLQKALTPDTILVSVMHANNEVGTIQPIRELADLAHGVGAAFHTDAAQTMGKLPVDVESMGVDLLSIAGHKLYAPKGVGALYVRTGTKLDKLMFGANHESDRRPGTENVLEIVGLGKASEIAQRDLEQNMAHFKAMRDRLHDGLKAALPENSFLLNGHPDLRLPNTLSLGFHMIEANTFLAEIGDRVAASAGAACHSDEIDLSHVLEAMHAPIDYAMGTVRFSVGRMTSEDEIDRALEIMVKSLSALLTESTQNITPLSEDPDDIKLTHYTAGLGCACKLRPQALEKVLANLPPSFDPKALVDASTNDDAAVYQVSADLAVVQTVDFFTPIIDSPYWFGAISAANSLSDIYAMGAEPIFALNIVGFPSNRLPLSVLEEILRGAQDKAQEAGISVLGGHTVDDNEPKFGMAVTGLVAPDKVIRNSTAQPGDALILTKPIGLGILTTALKQGLVGSEVEERLIRVMSRLNRAAAESMRKYTVHACTDVTGFGLLGHLHEMTQGSKVDARIALSSVPIIPEARDLAAMDVVPGGTLNNLAYVETHIDFDDKIDHVSRILLADAQTSGGLLISLPAGQAEELLTDLSAKGIEAARIGEMTGEGPGRISVIK
ncbi:MAG: selenide, water dikinase SelD [Anaerolineaceae bacterium]|jgi:cysteine desulfurase NifS/selenium donor protein|nr:selenide, water dikinase SelD [Anaerolineaceae bacterium]